MSTTPLRERATSFVHSRASISALLGCACLVGCTLFDRGGIGDGGEGGRDPGTPAADGTVVELADPSGFGEDQDAGFSFVPRGETPERTPATGSGGAPPATDAGDPAPDACTIEDVACIDGSRLRTCAGGRSGTHDCAQSCATAGFESGACSEGACACAGPNDARCILAARAMCSCSQWIGGPACSETMAGNVYAACHRGGETPKCFSEFVGDDSVDCLGAITTCL